MKDKISIPNPLFIWTSLTPWTKRTIIIVFGVIVVTAMVTGNFDTLVGFLPGSEGKK